MDPPSERAVIKALSKDKRQGVCEVLQDIVFTEEHMKRLMSTLEQQINYANSPKESEQKKSDLWWGYTFVSGVLEGNENGTYIGLDLGDTHFRVVLVEFTNGVADTCTKYYSIHKDLLTGPCEKVFDQIASCIQMFLHDEEVRSDNPIPLGFTFSFPADQTSLKHCTLTTWAKDFQCTTGVGLDPCLLLEEAIVRHGGLSTPVNVVARMGDSTGTLMAAINVDKNCSAGLILGAGSNICIVEYKSNYKKKKIDDPNCEKILVDLEWGAFGDNGCCDFYKNEFEREVNKHSSHPDSNTFEKSFSGMYIGELVRLCLMKLTNKGYLFGGKASEKLSTRWSLNAESIAAIERDTDDNKNTLLCLQNLNLDKTASEEDLALVKEVCYLVSKRGAYIVASALALILKRMNKKEVSVGIDGSLYENQPNYHKHMVTVLQKLLPDVKVKLFFIKDGSAEGAAFVAAVATKEK